MATLVLRQPRTRPSYYRLFLLVAVLAAAALGGWRIFTISQPVADPAVLRVGAVSYSVSHVEQVAGLSEEDLSGMSHGIQGLVTDDKALIRLNMVVRSGSSSVIYDPSVLRITDDKGGPAIAPAGGSLSQGGLGAHAQIEGSLAFIVPRAGQHYALHAPHDSHAIDLISVDRAPGGAGGHQHSAPSHASVAPTAQPSAPQVGQPAPSVITGN